MNQNLLKKKKIIFFPIESSSRETTSRRKLAEKLIVENPDLYVVIIEQQLLRLVSFIIPNAVFFGKHFFSKPKHKDDSYYRRIKKGNGVVVYLHEEGVFSGEIKDWQRILSNTMKPDLLAKDDTLLLWSDWQKSFFERNYKLECKVLVSGHPRFDLYKKLQKTNKPYDILVNTSFSYSNNAQGLSFIFSGKNPSYNFFNNKEYLFESYFSQTASQNWIEKWVFRIASKFPNKKIVLRPHPSENLDYYNTLFTTIENVQVYRDETIEEALSKTKIVIQVGCTTSIEAFMAGIPCYTSYYYGNNRATIAKDLSLDLPTDSVKDIFNFKNTSISSEEVIEKYSKRVLKNLDLQHDSTGQVINIIKEKSKTRNSYSLLFLSSTIIVLTIIYLFVYWPIKFLYYILNGRTSEFKDFKQRFNPSKPENNTISILKYTEIYS